MRLRCGSRRRDPEVAWVYRVLDSSGFEGQTMSKEEPESDLTFRSGCCTFRIYCSNDLRLSSVQICSTPFH
jgi:hypothetical protein